MGLPPGQGGPDSDARDISTQGFRRSSSGELRLSTIILDSLSTHWPTNLEKTNKENVHDGRKQRWSIACQLLTKFYRVQPET